MIGTDVAADLGEAAILVVDDEPGMRNFLAKMLGPACTRLDVCENAEAGAILLDANVYDVIILDNIMPGQTGVEWLAEQRRIGLYSDVVIITAHADLDTAIAALRAGASDIVLKPFRSNQIIHAVAQSLRRNRMQRQNSVLNYELETGTAALGRRSVILGDTPESAKIREAITVAGAIQSSVVIRGEIGSGRQAVARMLHASSERARGPFLWLQCHGLSDEAFRDRLLGHISPGGGADDAGLLMTAAGGTLFLDDVDTLSPGCQALLIELLSTGRFRPIGASRAVPLDVRVVSSATASLEEMVREGTFRPDLYYLLNVISIAIPPLRERGDDIILLAEFFLDQFAERTGRPRPTLDPAERRRLLAYDWPGNVMELRNAAERAIILGSFDIGPPDRPAAEATETLAAVEQRHILKVLEQCGGNRAEAARRLGVARKTIDRKCQSWGI